MTAITADDVKTLREKTGAGMLDCKKALSSSGGDMEKAVDWLRQKGLSAAAKKSGRTAAEGLVGVMVAGKVAVMVEINAETDFVARNDKFQNLMTSALEAAIKEARDGDITESLQKKLQSTITELVATIGENMNLRRAKKITSDGVIASYIHNALTPTMGKIGVVVSLGGDPQKTPEVGKKLAMHIAAQNPQYLHIADVPADILAREKSVLTEQAKESKKPEAVIQKMVEGRIKKFYEEVVLIEQPFILDPNQKIGAWLKSQEKGIGHATIKDFILFRLGEGIEKKQDDFVVEVAAMTRG